MADALDSRPGRRRSSPTAKPDVIVHELTAIDALDLRHFDRGFAAHQPAADRGDRSPAVGRARGRRQAIRGPELCGLAVGAHRRPVKTEDEPFDPAPPREMRESLEAIRHLEAAVTGADWTEGIVLRYGGFYGPGTSLAPGGEQFEMVRKRKFPVVGERRRHLVVRARRRRRRGDGGGDRPWPARDLQRGRRRAGAGCRVAAGAWRGDRRAQAAARFRVGSAGWWSARPES